MSWFHFTKQERLKAEIAARRDTAEHVRKSIRRKDFYALSPRLFEEVIHDATELPYTFEEYFQEAAPQQLRKAADLEVQLWTHLRDAHNSKQFGDREYEHLLTRTGLIVTALIDLLHAEEEMTSSPLVAHYLQVIDAVRKYAARGDA
jgi:hypothetical protein